MARKKQFDENTALAAAMKLFWEKGYAASSMQDIEAVTGLNRTSIYNAFGNKRSLFKKALTLYMALVRQRFQRIFAEAVSCRAAVKSFLEEVIDLHFKKDSPGGCLVVLSVMESSQHDAETRQMAEKMFQDERRMLQKALEQGKKRRELSEGFDAAGVATAISAVASGLVVLAKAGFSGVMLSEMIQAAMKLLDE